MELLTVRTEDYVASIAKRKNKLAEELEELQVNYGWSNEVDTLKDKIDELSTMIDVFGHYDEETLQIDLDKYKLMIEHHSVELDF